MGCSNNLPSGVNKVKLFDCNSGNPCVKGWAKSSTASCLTPRLTSRYMDIIPWNPIQYDALKASWSNPTELIELGHKEIIPFSQPFFQFFLDLIFQQT
jgi:hypothetical protein